MIIKNFPNLRQAHDFDCGATALQAVLAYYGIDERAGKIMKQVGTTETGTPIEKIKETAKKYGLKTEMAEMKIEDVKKYLGKKIPVILLLQAYGDGHYVVAIGCDKNKIYFEDPESIYRTFLTYEELEKRWHDVIAGKEYVNYGIAIFGKKPAFDNNKTIPMG